jgi:hypothetical protein
VVAERFEDLSARIAELEHKGVGKDGGSARPRLMRSRDFH